MLDQGYWSDSLYTPASPECFDQDILAMKTLGFNTLRRHIKVEPELFYSACDRLPEEFAHYGAELQKAVSGA